VLSLPSLATRRRQEQFKEGGYLGNAAGDLNPRLFLRSRLKTAER